MLVPDSLLGWVVALAAAALVCLLLQSEEEGAPAAEPTGGADADAGGAGVDAPTCRICYAGGEAGRLFTPCLCRGSMAHVHACADTYVPGPPYCTCGLRVPASCGWYRAYQPPAYRTYLRHRAAAAPAVRTPYACQPVPYVARTVAPQVHVDCLNEWRKQ